MMNQAPVVQGEDSCLSGELSLSNHERKHFNLFSRNSDLSTKQTRPGLFLIPLVTAGNGRDTVYSIFK